MKNNFIEKANKIHNNKYNYSKLKYINLNVKGIIICPIHGEFEQKLHSHLYLKQGCKLCAIEKRSNKKRKTIKQFINEANKIHNNKYEYNDIVYKNNSTKIIIICPIHGKFKQTPKEHLNGHGCNICGGTKKLKQDDFINEVKEIHNNRYNYSKVKYKNGKEKIKIICPIHGEFEQTPENHKNRKSGCPYCAVTQSSYEKEIFNILRNINPDLNIINNISTQKIMNINFNNKIKDKNITLLSPYIKSKFKIKLKCNICNYEWETFPYVLYRSGCPSCAKQIKPTIEEFKEKLFKINPNLIILSKEYINNKTYLDIKCNKCEYEFKAKPHKLLSNNAVCQNCSSRNKKTHNQYINKFSFNESITLLSEFKDYKTQIKVKCNKCNYEWNILPSNLNKGQGCPNCFKRISSYENEIYNILKNKNIERNKRFKNYEIDLFFPDYSFGIEFNGLYYHSDEFKEKNYHKDKYLHFKKLNIDLIQIFENEWINKKEIVLSIINNRFSLNKNKIFARKCLIKEVDINLAKQFCNNNHIQGYANSTIKLGLFYNDELISLITLRKNRFNKDGTQEIIRFCNKLNTSVIGGFQKLLSYIKNELNIKELISFVDVRYFNGHSYKNYEYQYHTSPNYYYFINNKELFNRMSFQKHKLKNKLKIFNENLSEYENMCNNGFKRIFDAGHLKFILKL